MSTNLFKKIHNDLNVCIGRDELPEYFFDNAQDYAEQIGICLPVLHDAISELEYIQYYLGKHPKHADEGIQKLLAFLEDWEEVKNLRPLLEIVEYIDAYVTGARDENE